MRLSLLGVPSENHRCHVRRSILIQSTASYPLPSQIPTKRFFLSGRAGCDWSVFLDAVLDAVPNATRMAYVLFPFLTEICPVRNTRSGYHRQSTPDRQDYCSIMETHKEERKGEDTEARRDTRSASARKVGTGDASVRWSWISRPLPFSSGTPPCTEPYGATAPVINDHHDYDYEYSFLAMASLAS